MVSRQRVQDGGARKVGDEAASCPLCHRRTLEGHLGGTVSQEWIRSHSIYVPILALGLGLQQEAMTPFPKSTPIPKSWGTGFSQELRRVAGGGRSEIVGQMTLPHSIFSPVPC